jgi:hypothetical protein
MNNRDDEAFARQILELIVAAGDDGVERQELVAGPPRAWSGSRTCSSGCGPGVICSRPGGGPSTEGRSPRPPPAPGANLLRSTSANRLVFSAWAI